MEVTGSLLGARQAASHGSGRGIGSLLRIVSTLVIIIWVRLAVVGYADASGESMLKCACVGIIAQCAERD